MDAVRAIEFAEKQVYAKPEEISESKTTHAQDLSVCSYEV